MVLTDVYIILQVLVGTFLVMRFVIMQMDVLEAFCLRADGFQLERFNVVMLQWVCFGANFQITKRYQRSAFDSGQPHQNSSVA